MIDVSEILHQMSVKKLLKKSRNETRICNSVFVLY